MAILRDHSNRDLTVFGDITVPDAVLQALATVKYAKGRNNRGVIWVGESHAYGCDVNRRQGLFDSLYPDEGIILVAESGLSSGARLGGDLVESLIKNRVGGVTEADDRTTYGVAERNRKISERIIAECAKDPPGQPRAVVIIFGDDHLAPIKKLLIEGLPANEIVEWWDCPPISDVLLARASTKLPSADTHEIVCGAKEPKWGSDADVMLLQRACGLKPQGSITFTALSPIYFQMKRLDVARTTYALFIGKNDPVKNAFSLWNPTGNQAITFEYPNFSRPSLDPYTVVYVKTQAIFDEVARRAEADG
jgi:hypothetical protein